MPRAIPPDTGAPEVLLGKDQPEYTPLPAAVYRDTEYDTNVFLTRWTFTLEERLAIAEGEDLYISQMTGHKQGYPPVRVCVGPAYFQLRKPDDA